MFANKTLSFAEIDQSLKLSSETKVWELINIQNILNHVSDWSFHLTGKCRKKFSPFGLWQLLFHPKLHHHSRSICFVYFTLLTRKLKWFGFILWSQTKVSAWTLLAGDGQAPAAGLNCKHCITWLSSANANCCYIHCVRIEVTPKFKSI